MRMILMTLATLVFSCEGGEAPLSTKIGAGARDWQHLGDIGNSKQTVSVYKMKDPDTGAWIYVSIGPSSLQVIPAK